MGIVTEGEGAVARVVVDYPPVNALPVAGWSGLAETFRSLGRDDNIRAIVLSAEGRGFNAGVDIKEIQQQDNDLDRHKVLVNVNKGCAEAFAAVYECPVPVISAVHGFCLGGGIGLVGNSDIILASEDAYFGLPEVDRGALGAATHLARLVPQHKMRAMVYMAETATAQELHAFGSVLEVLPPDQLRDRAVEIARSIEKKNPTVIRAAKGSLNGIDLWDVRRSYRFEQGFTFEVTLTGAGDEARQAFVGDADTASDE